MSNCANIINKLSAEVCQLKETLSKVSGVVDLLTIQNAIIANTDLTVYVIPSDSACCKFGVPAKVQVTSCDKVEQFDALLVLSKYNCKNCYAISTKDLCKISERRSSGLIEITGQIEINVLDVDECILKNVSSHTVVNALQECSKSCTDLNISCHAYDALLAFLSSYGIRKLTVNQAACIYKYLKKHHHDDEHSSDSCEPYEPYEPYEPNEPYEPYEPNEPFEPSEPSEISYSLVFKTVSEQLNTISDSTGSDAIEKKLRDLLEGSDTVTEN